MGKVNNEAKEYETALKKQGIDTVYRNSFKTRFVFEIVFYIENGLDETQFEEFCDEFSFVEEYLKDDSEINLLESLYDFYTKYEFYSVESMEDTERTLYSFLEQYSK